MSDLKLNAYYYSFAPTGQREVDLILHAVARAGKAFHHTSQWTEDEMAEFYEHCEGDTCVEWIQNAANKAAAELAALYKRAEQAEGELHEIASVLPGVAYMDPPDGGSPSIPEQFRRMRADLDRTAAEVEQMRADAERYRVARRKVCIVGDSFHVINLRPTYVAPDAAIEFDAAIDAAIARGKE